MGGSLGGNVAIFQCGEDVIITSHSIKGFQFVSNTTILCMG